jgi:ketosteroid isomerase-like protein
MTNEQVVRRYFECIDREDWAGLRQLFAPSASLSAVGARSRTGLDEIVDYYERALGPWTHHSDVPTRLIAAGDTFTVEVKFTGETPDGRTVTFDAVDIFDLCDGSIVAFSSWYDTDYARRALTMTERPA